MNRKLIFAIMLIVLTVGGVFNTFWVGKFFRIRGDFTPSLSWSWGYPGRVLFDIATGSTNSGFAPGIDLDGYLSGSFWLGNVGWTTFNHNIAGVDRARVLCANIVFNDPSVTCPVDGYAWSQNSGWIALSGSFVGGSWVYYNPAAARIQGFGHSRALWWIPFYADTTTPVTTTTQTGVLLNGMGLNFIGKIAIIGNIAGTRIFNVTNQQVWYVFTTINHADMLNIIRKNIALLSRNADPTEMANPFGTKFNFLLQRGADYDTSVPGWTWPSSKKSIIIIGGDVILDQADIGLVNTNKALIVLKDESGSGWNIIIREWVGRIYAFLYAEGSIYSGNKTATGLIVPYVAKWVWNIPGNQLYIKWAIISKNTIWWSLQSPPTCPVVVGNCNTVNSQIYDVNYFRTYDSTDLTQRNIPSTYYNDPRFSLASTVIEYNQSLATDPPPGISSILQ